jgi:hypothetical protein
MNLPSENQQTQGPVDDRLVDRLVDGELADAERRELLLRLEREADGWRRCALAFLEAQNWRQAFGPLVASDLAPAMGGEAGVESSNARHPVHSRGVAALGAGHRPRSWRAVARLTGLAAGLAAAFALGWGVHSPPEKPATYDSANQQAISSESPEPAPVKVAARESEPWKSTEPDQLDPIVKRWEQRGYSVELQQRLLSMELKDGRKINVPVREVRLRYVGNRTY